MSIFDELLTANDAYVRAGAHRDVPARPARHLAVVTCMDARIDVLAALGLSPGDAHVIRTAGGRVTDDVLRSLTLSTHLLGTRSAAVVAHTDCGVLDPEGRVPERLTAAIGRPPASREWHTFTDAREAIAEDCARLHSWGDRPDGFEVGGYLLDVDDGRLHEVVSPSRVPPAG